MDIRSFRIFQVTCPRLSFDELEDPIHETSLHGIIAQAHGAPNIYALKDHGFFSDEEEARQEIAARLRIQRDLIDKQITMNDVAIAKLREGRRGSPVRPVKVTKK